MYFVALAADYDGTIAKDGIVDQATLNALERFKASGRKLILVTGRELPDLELVFPKLAIFDVAIVENGALMFRPGSKEIKQLAPSPPPAFVERLGELGVRPISVGRSIVATWQPHEMLVLQAIRELGLEHHIVFNKGAVMVLPPNVNKATGLAAALTSLHISPRNVVGIGDAENDHAFLMSCGCAVAVNNALPAIKAEVDVITGATHGAGTAEIIERVLADDLADLTPTLARHRITLGLDSRSGEAISFGPHMGSILISGMSGSGKSTTVTALLEQVCDQQYQFCIVDPEGDYETFEEAITIGGADKRPRVRDALELLKEPANSAILNLIDVDLPERARFLSELLVAFSQMRAQTGRPHWLVIDEAHHMLPASQESASLPARDALPATIFVTVHPDQLSRAALKTVDAVVAVGPNSETALHQFFRTMAVDIRSMPIGALRDGEVYFWQRGSAAVRTVQVQKPRSKRQRHARKYAEGELPEDRSFYFRGPRNAFNLRAQNLAIFLQIAQGIDDKTWLHHLRAQDYSNWFRHYIKDEDLANRAAAIERDKKLSAVESRQRIKQLIDERYTAPEGVSRV